LNTDGTDQVKRFDKSWKAACKTAEIGKRLFHDFRRSAVRNMAKHQRDSKSIPASKEADSCHLLSMRQVSGAARFRKIKLGYLIRATRRMGSALQISYHQLRAVSFIVIDSL
jgi:hypothetical protein